MNSGNKMLMTLLFCASVLMAGCTGPSDKKLSETPVNVEVQHAASFDGSREISYSGTIEESESIPLSFSCIGNVSKVLVSEGDFVKKGSLIAVLNDATYRNTYEMTLASEKRAQDAYNRLLPMYNNGNLPEIKLVEVETALEQAKAAALIAKKNLDDCRLYSPVDGIVGKRSIDPGMSALPNLASVTIVKIEKVYVKVSVPEGEIASIKKGNKADIIIAALGNARYTGLIKEIGVLADPIAHTYMIKIELINKDRQIKPGMICNVTLDKELMSGGLVIPECSVLTNENGERFVYVVNQNKAIRKTVQTGKLLKDGVEITSGITPGELIITAGQQKLANNSPVTILN